MDQNLDQTILDDVNATTASHTYAGFWMRFGAMLIDTVIVWVVNMLLALAFSPTISMIANIVIVILYYSIMESSAYQGTLGKLAVGIKVVTEDGQTLSFGQAIGRYFMRIISAAILLIGYFMMLWSDKKQTLHDKVVGSIVVYR